MSKIFHLHAQVFPNEVDEALGVLELTLLSNLIHNEFGFKIIHECLSLVAELGHVVPEHLDQVADFGRALTAVPELEDDVLEDCVSAEVLEQSAIDGVFDEGVGIDLRLRLRVANDHALVRDDEEVECVVSGSCSEVDEDEVRVEAVNMALELFLPLVREVG